MRLLRLESDDEFELVTFDSDELPPYAILSHTWVEGEEVTYDELIAGAGKDKAGYNKIRFCAKRAALDGLQYFWVDTCCINKSIRQEIDTAINSMFRWYQGATRCYVYLVDVCLLDEAIDGDACEPTWMESFRQSRWFTRGWTLQELLAPPRLEFFSNTGKLLGNRSSLEKEIHEATKIPVGALRGQHLSNFSVQERMSWAQNRTTTYKEDKIYCLLGIFGVFLPLIYGEGEEYASLRLRDEILRHSERKSWGNREGVHDLHHTSLMCCARQISLPAQIEDPKPVYFTDACAFQARIDLTWINSWEAFLAVLRVRFKERGLKIVERRQFVLEDAHSKMMIEPSRPFGMYFMPGRKINMDAFFKEKEQTRGKCPSCRYEDPDAKIDEEVNCSQCGTHYRRIEEISNDEPEREQTRPTTQTSRRNRPAKKRKAKHNIARSIPDLEEESDSSDDDLSHFRRIRLRTQREEESVESNLELLAELAKAYKKHNRTIHSPAPSVKKQLPLDLYKLKRAVDEKGGFDVVSEQNRWAEVGRELGFSSIATASLKDTYKKWLDPYEGLVKTYSTRSALSSSSTSYSTLPSSSLHPQSGFMRARGYSSNRRLPIIHHGGGPSNDDINCTLSSDHGYYN